MSPGDQHNDKADLYSTIIKDLKPGTQYKTIDIFNDGTNQLLVDNHCFICLYGIKDGEVVTIIDRLPYGMGGWDYYKCGHDSDGRVILLGTDYDLAGDICKFYFYSLSYDGIQSVYNEPLIKGYHNGVNYASEGFEQLFIDCEDYFILSCDEVQSDGVEMQGGVIDV